MELRQLKYFVGIADTKHFSDASRQLFITQSAISQQIKLLEEELGTQLFVRQPHNVVLTESGEMLLPIARQILRNVTDCYDCIADLKGLMRGELNIGLTYTLEPYMRETMLNFMKEYPKVHLNAYYKTLPELLNKLRLREVDVMLSIMPTSEHNFADSEHLMDYRLTAIMKKTHPLAKKEMLTFSDLQTQRLILPEKGLRDRNAIESYIHAETGDLNVCALVNDANAILNLLRDSNTVSILTESIINNHPSLRSIPIKELSSPVKVYAHFNNTVSRKHSAEVFLNMFKQTSAYYMNSASMDEG